LTSSPSRIHAVHNPTITVKSDRAWLIAVAQPTIARAVETAAVKIKIVQKARHHARLAPRLKSRIPYSSSKSRHSFRRALNNPQSERSDALRWTA
jgi:hypothetical protein